MLIRLERASGMPITRQILDQIRTQCATGALSAGDQLPSVRELALSLAVNQNTILRVYERLEAEGLIERRHGSGTFVADGGPRDPLKHERERLRLEAASLARHAHALGLSPEDAAALLKQAFTRIDKKPRGGGQP